MLPKKSKARNASALLMGPHESFIRLFWQRSLQSVGGSVAEEDAT